MLVNEQREFLLCAIAKVATTNWKKIMVLLKGNETKFTSPESIPFRFVHTASTFPISRVGQMPVVRQRMRDYYKFMFVREPFERLISAYFEVLNTKEHRKLNDEIKKKYQSLWSPAPYLNDVRTLFGNRSCTFPQFVQYVIDSRSAGQQLDPHWRPQTEYCRPCDIKYDFIGHYETLVPDANYVLGVIRSRNSKHTNGSTVSEFPEPEKWRYRRAGSFVERLWATLSVESQKGLLETYKYDYELFDYKRPQLKKNWHVHARSNYPA